MKQSTQDEGISEGNEITDQKKTNEGKIDDRQVDEKGSYFIDQPKEPQEGRSVAPEQGLEVQEKAVNRHKQQYHDAIQAYKSPGVSEDQRKKSKEAVRRAEMKLKDAMQAVEDPKASSSAAKTEDTTRDEHAKDPLSESAESAVHKWSAKESRKEEIEVQVTQYQSQYREAVKAYKSPNLGEGDKRKAKEQMKRREEKLKQATTTLEALVKKGENPENPHEQTPREDRPQTEVIDRPKEAADSSKQRDEVELKKLRSQYAEIMKVYKTKDLGVDDKKKTKEKLIFLEQPIKRTQQELHKIGKAEIPTAQETNQDKTNSAEKNIQNLDETHTKATEDWDKALKEYVTKPDMTEEEKGKAREKVKVAKGKSDNAQQDLRAAQEAQQSGKPQERREEEEDTNEVVGHKDRPAVGSPISEPTKEPLAGDEDRQQRHVPDNDDARDKKAKAYKAEYSQLAHRLKSGIITAPDREKYTKRIEGIKAKFKELAAPSAFEIAESTKTAATSPTKVTDKATLLTQAVETYAALKKGAQEEGVSREERQKREATALRQREIVNSLEKELHEQNASRGNDRGVTPDEVRGAILQAPLERGETAYKPQSRATEDGEGDRHSSSEEQEVPITSDAHEAWAPLKLSRKSSPAPPTPPKSPARTADRKISPVQPEVGDITWSKTLISLANCIALANRILKSLDKSPSPSPITEVVQHLIVGLVMQKDVLLSLKEVVGENGASMIDEFGEHVAVVRSYVEDLVVRRKEGKMSEDGVVQVEKAVEKGSQVLESVTVQSIVNHLVEFTEYLTPGMIATLKEVANEWKKEGLGVKVIIHTVLAIRKQLAIIQRSKEQTKQIEEKKRTEGLIGTLDKVLALFSSDHQAEVEEAKVEIKSGRLSLPAPPDDEAAKSDMTSIGTMVRKDVKKDKGKRREDHVDVDVRHKEVKSPNPTIKPENIPIPSTPTPDSSKLYPISSTSSPMPRSHTPIEEPPSSLSHLMSKITHKLHPSSKSRHGDTERESSKKSRPKPEPIIAPSPHDGKMHDMKLPQTTQNFLSGGSSWKRRPRIRSNSTSSSFSATIPYTAPLPHPPSDSAPSTPYTGESGMDQSSPSRYSQTSVETSTTASDNAAGELLAQADSGPQPVKHEWRDELDSTGRGDKHEASEEQVKRAEDVLYNRVLAVPDITRDRRKRRDYI
ncbi:hypothetical protein I302_104543 [Kwoniella bestiolae CBS 10118]|uniref:Uncharacterized protein n=1 Tax=Kwoniella bestiolae CBS 10118 TaxID=1296100 RepID=A0A1B9GBI8_9TREE|nr:hypothetical protein I302_03248 [Kwoniella bestiolae CBS 10118]OCF28389.1 hypothetical protein I302_03248 [Kwoniella bestiolae CBS 10118]